MVANCRHTSLTRESTCFDVFLIHTLTISPPPFASCTAGVHEERADEDLAMGRQRPGGVLRQPRMGPCSGGAGTEAPGTVDGTVHCESHVPENSSNNTQPVAPFDPSIRALHRRPDRHVTDRHLRNSMLTCSLVAGVRRLAGWHQHHWRKAMNRSNRSAGTLAGSNVPLGLHVSMYVMTVRTQAHRTSAWVRPFRWAGPLLIMGDGTTPCLRGCPLASRVRALLVAGTQSRENAQLMELGCVERICVGRRCGEDAIRHCEEVQARCLAQRIRHH